MRKTLLYIVLLLVLAGSVYYFIFGYNTSVYAKNEAGFTIKDTSAVGRFFIAGPNGHTILAERTDSGWIINKKYKALRGEVRTVLGTLAQQQALYPAPKNMYNGVIHAMAGNGIKVEVYDRKGEKMRVFYVGGEAPGYKGTYMLMDGAKEPYVVNEQGFNGYLTPNYSYELIDWRDRTVFDMKPEQIKSIAVTYPQHPVNSFVLNQDNGKLTVTGDKAVMSSNAFNERRARVYVKYFQNVNCEGFATNEYKVDSVLSVMPKYVTFVLTGNNGQAQRLDVYHMPLNRRSKNRNVPNQNSDENTYDADRFYGVMNNYKDTIVVQAFIFNKMLRNMYEFYQPDGQEQQQAEPKQERKYMMPAPPVNTAH